MKLTLLLASFVAVVSQSAGDQESSGCECVPGSGEFCGVDGQCHPYSCETWYEFGPRRLTGYDVASPSRLACQDIPMTEPGGWNNGGGIFQADVESVEFRCRSLTPAPIQMGWTSRCSATRANSDLTCYGLAASTDFRPFLERAAASELACTDDRFDETGYPKFSYTVFYEAKNPEGNSSAIIRKGFNSTPAFNETLALAGTMYTRYENRTDQPTRFPTGTPTRSPTLSPSWALNSALKRGSNAIMSTMGSSLGLIVLARVMI